MWVVREHLKPARLQDKAGRKPKIGLDVQLSDVKAGDEARELGRANTWQLVVLSPS